MSAPSRPRRRADWIRCGSARGAGSGPQRLRSDLRADASPVLQLHREPPSRRWSGHQDEIAAKCGFRRLAECIAADPAAAASAQRSSPCSPPRFTTAPRSSASTTNDACKSTGQRGRALTGTRSRTRSSARWSVPACSALPSLTSTDGRRDARRAADLADAIGQPGLFERLADGRVPPRVKASSAASRARPDSLCAALVRALRGSPGNAPVADGETGRRSFRNCTGSTAYGS
jgi:hypothetical protein